MATLEGAPASTPQDKRSGRMTQREYDLLRAQRNDELGGDPELSKYLREQAARPESADTLLSLTDSLAFRRSLKPKGILGRISLRKKPSAE